MFFRILTKSRHFFCILSSFCGQLSGQYRFTRILSIMEFKKSKAVGPWSFGPKPEKSITSASSATSTSTTISSATFRTKAGGGAKVTATVGDGVKKPSNYSIFNNKNRGGGTSSAGSKTSKSGYVPPKTTDQSQPEQNEVVKDDGFIHDDEYVVVYTDGACSGNGRKGSNAGIGAWFGHDHHLNISEPAIGRQTNNVAEIQAAERAILQAKANCVSKLMIKTDSKFLINCITAWMPKWLRNGWKGGKGKDVINKDDLVKLNKALVGMDVKWIYVAGHSGHKGNEAADRLAVNGASKNNSTSNGNQNQAGPGKRKRNEDED